ncbi:xanthine dehydrogenase/oxidase isoform X1 [Nilaparvata lugens]|uniref:xanthine dehydrogenase/oxidase isoform X1 n=3 Tax=Nilaparvata lugens TaxID=108931 RepID=UPI00193CDAE4|nr:xanthine dehydrogenase/oxidase isoform X1 [Nilaparvata lugens]
MEGDDEIPMLGDLRVGVGNKLIDYKYNKTITFTINGNVYRVSDDVKIGTSLNTFIRDNARLKATKFMCTEGGCGCCIVSVKIVNQSTRKVEIFAVNSCLVMVHACNGWAIITNEGIGSKKAGYNKIQTTLASFNGSQCGYCSPGMVMNMYSLLQANPKVKMEEVENAFGGNICRCTGYRNILDAFKSLAVDAPKELKLKFISDMEDVQTCCKSDKVGCCNKICSKTRQKNEDELENTADDCEHDFVELALAPLSVRINDYYKSWYTANSKAEIFQILEMAGGRSFMLLCGGTSKGLYKSDPQPNWYIDISRVRSLKQFVLTNDYIKLGASTTLAEAIKHFRHAANRNPLKFSYGNIIADHIDHVATVPVRNIGTLAGNVSIKHKHRDFPSDIFLLLETVGAVITLEESDGVTETVGMMEYLQMNADRKLITKFSFPALETSKYYIKTYKVMKRAQNAVAYVNAGFRFQLDKFNNYKVIDLPRIVFGGISPGFVHAKDTEKFLFGKNLLDQATLQRALEILKRELRPNTDLTKGSVEYRKNVAMSLFYKFVLSISPETVAAIYRSGGGQLIRNISGGEDKFDTNESIWPVTKPIPKLDALLQCSGEAVFVNDIQEISGQLFCSFVIATVGNAKIKSIDAAQALKMPGVQAFYSAKDIPGENNFQPVDWFTPENEKIFCDEDVWYAGQPIGVIVADSWDLANRAARLVKVEYSHLNKPLITVPDVLATKDQTRIMPLGEVKAKSKKDNVKHVIKGRMELGKQYHFTIEPQTCLCIPKEDGMDVISSTQWTHNVQSAVSVALGIPTNKVRVEVPRLGGGFGGKFSRASLPAAASAIAAHLLQRPTRLIMDLETNMQVIGFRYPLITDYEVGVDEDGEIQYLDATFYQDIGGSLNDILIPILMETFPSMYNSDTWSFRGIAVRTNTPPGVYFRAPGSLESLATVEHIMEHISRKINKDVHHVRLKNIKEANNEGIQMIMNMRQSSDYDMRKEAVDKFNMENRWKKKGIAIMPTCYPMTYYGVYHAAVSIYELDGTVTVSHGGTDMGQAVHTKVAQIAARTLGIDIAMIKVESSNTFVGPNNCWSGNSQTTEGVCRATIKCCEEILNRLEVIKSEMKDASWPALIKAAFNKNINLHNSQMWKAEDSKHYIINGVCVTEVELDILTGENLITRVDLIEDAGQSLNPEVDIGQIHGAFVANIGYLMSEELIFDPDTGALLTNNSWTYKPPSIKDIPVDFRVELKKNSNNPFGVFGSKAVGEPPATLAPCILLAFRHAVDSARQDSGLQEEWFEIVPPLTPEKLFTLCHNSISQYSI